LEDAALPLTTHLAELRNRIVKILVAWIAGALAAWSSSETIFDQLLAPAVQALGENGVLQAIAPTEIFFTYLKSALLAGFGLALPIIFWQIWAFVAPGIYPSEKRVAVPFVLISTVLFLSGAAFGYSFVFPLIFDFFVSFDSANVVSAWTMSEVFTLTTRLILAFGAGFEMPVVVFFLAVSGILEPRQLLGGFKYAVLVSFVMAAVLTPPDVISQVMLAVPLLALYLLGVGVAYVFAPPRRDTADDAIAEPPEREGAA